MKTLFNNKQVFPHVPIPKKNQVWQSESGKLIKINQVTKDSNKEIVSALIEDQSGNLSVIGLGWLNGYEYKYIGNIF